MNSSTIEKVSDVFQQYFIKVIEDYKETALLINACFVSKDRYEQKKKILALSTIGGIPLEYRFPSVDIDRRIGREQLVSLYRNEIPMKVATNYLITTVATLDAAMEDVYEVLLIERSGINEQEAHQRVSQLWRFFMEYLKNDLKLKKPNGHKYDVDAYLNTYTIWRNIRHALLHNRGVLSEKNRRIISEIDQMIPEENRVMGSPLIKADGTITLDLSTIYILRFWCLSFITYMQGAFNQTLTDELGH